jgi:hypothetical protein
LCDICILTKTALEIAANRGNGIGKGTGEDMIEWLLFNGIHMLGNQLSINKGF